jgi:tetratricopeptide (TPR) repeat protein
MQVSSVVWISICGSIISIGCRLPAWSISPVEVGKIAKAITVNIGSTTSPGSGAIIQKQGNTYTVLTAAHVVKNQDPAMKIVTADGQEYKLTNIKMAKGTDLATVKFQSTNSYPAAKLGDAAKSLEGSTVYVSGFPVATQAISTSIYNFTEGKVTANANRNLAEGYSLVYSNSTLPGMSGGPVLNDDGELIAIHGRGDTQENYQVSQINQNVRVKTGFNLGITVTTFLKMANSLGVSFGNTTPVVAARPQNPKADDFFLNGVEAFHQGRWSLAAEMMDKATQANPRYVRAYVARGAANFMQNRVSRAIGDADRAITIDPQYALGYVSQCFFLGEFKMYGRALGYCNKGIELAPNSAIAYSVRGGIRIMLKDLSGAERDLLQAIELDPKSYYAYGNLSAVYSARKVPQLALRYARTAVSLNPNSAAARVQFAQALVTNKDYIQAIGEVNRAINTNPQIANAYTVRSLAYAGLGNTTQARNDALVARTRASAAPQGAIEDLSFLSQ